MLLVVLMYLEILFCLSNYNIKVEVLVEEISQVKAVGPSL
jgi:hypothetical protein